MAARNLLSICIAFEVQMFNDSIGIRLKSALDLGKKYLVAIFSAIVYCLSAALFKKFLHCEVSLATLNSDRNSKLRTYKKFKSNFKRATF